MNKEKNGYRNRLYGSLTILVYAAYSPFSFILGVVYVSVREDEDGYIHVTAHPDKLALECSNKEGSNSYCTCSASDSSSEEEVDSSLQRHSRRINRVETVEKLPHRYFVDKPWQFSQ